MPGSESSLRAFARRYVIAFGLALVTIIGAVVMVNYVFDEKFKEIDRVQVDTVESATEVTNYLLIGSDTRAIKVDEDDFFGSESDAGGQRSDTLMVVHVNPKKQQAVVVSFPRDLWVEIPGVPLDNTHCSSISTGKCMSKLNSAFNTGPDTVIQTLQLNYDIPINHYIEINFVTFEGIVDAVGDVPIYFPYPTRDEETGLFTPVAGCRLLDGKGALAYARSRHPEYYSFPNSGWLAQGATGDLARIQRQQDFMRRLMTLAVRKSLTNPLTANKVVDRIIPNLKIDDALQKDDLLGLIDVFSGVDANDSSKVAFLTLPATTGSAGSLSVLYVAETEAANLLKVMRDFSGKASHSSSPTTTAAGSSGTTAPTGATGATTTTTATTQVAPAPIIDDDELGPPAEKTAPCV